MEDPLLTLPPVIVDGARLPGDAMPLGCPAAVDWHSSLSLNDAVDISLCHNPQIQLAWANIKLQASALGQARAAYLPTLSGTVSQLKNKTQYPDFPDSGATNQGQTAYLGLTWRLFDFGARAANRDAANSSLLAALLSHDAVLQKTLAATIEAYFDAQTARAQYQAREQEVAMALRTLSTTKRRQEKGVVAQSDVLQAQAALAKAELGQQRAASDLKKAYALLAFTMNIPVDTDLHLASMLESVALDVESDLQHWLSEAQSRHPALLAARAQVEAARYKIQAARAEGLPSVDWTNNFYRNGYPNQGLQSTRSNTMTWGITLNIPIFDGFVRTYKVREAQAQLEQSEAQSKDTERQILSDVVKAHVEAVSALANLKSSAKLLEATMAALTSSENRYAKGAADIVELLNQQSALAEARQENVRSMAEWHSARLRLIANTGLLNRGELQR
ncbi:histidine kinase [Herbaspirillum rubrisubalbicans]|nr:histidine kinase [Herbaspirillum rubrisubalbicans]